jgi:hypothetical protein
MNQLKMGDILNLAAALQKEGMSVKEIALLPVYIGNDDELNGIHTAWYAEPLDPNDDDYKQLVEMINEDYGNIKIKGKAILIS